MSYFATGKFLDNFGDKHYKEIVTKGEIADAVELLGCWFVDKGRDLSKGIQLWSWAIMIRDRRKSYYPFFSKYTHCLFLRALLQKRLKCKKKGRKYYFKKSCKKPDMQKKGRGVF